MITENLSTLRIHKLTKEQFDRESATGNLEKTALYLTPDNSITLWQPNTEYKVGDVVVGYIDPYSDGMFSAVLYCKKDHNSSTVALPDEVEKLEDFWKWEALISGLANYAMRDIDGHSIKETYATKDELAEAIGEALEGDY